MKLPLVSIITPSYNQGQFIEDTILSIKNQDYPNIEHIIVDGGSTDNTLDIIKKYEGTYNMRWISEPDNGQADAVNKGFKMAKGEIIGWLNSDDVYLWKKTLTKVVDAFLSNMVEIIYGHILLIDANNNALKVQSFPNFNLHRMLRGCYIGAPAAFLRRKVIDQHTLDITLEYAMDYEFWLRLAIKGYKFLRINEILACDRVHIQRKIIKYKAETDKESTMVRRRYGQSFGLKYSIGRLVDKCNSGIRKCYELASLLKLERASQEDFAIPIKVNIDWTVIWNQIARKNRSLTLCK